MFSQHHNGQAIITCTHTSEIAQREINRPQLSEKERASRISHYIVRAALGQDLFEEVQERGVA
jgi:hypothetical protein